MERLKTTRRDDPVQVRMTPAEHAELREAAAGAGMGVSTYLRSTALQRARGRAGARDADVELAEARARDMLGLAQRASEERLKERLEYERAAEELLSELDGRVRALLLRARAAAEAYRAGDAAAALEAAAAFASMDLRDDVGDGRDPGPMTLDLDCVTDASDPGEADAEVAAYAATHGCRLDACLDRVGPAGGNPLYRFRGPRQALEALAEAHAGDRAEGLRLMGEARLAEPSGSPQRGAPGGVS